MATQVLKAEHIQEPALRVAIKHHWFVRVTHWLNIPILLGLILSGLSIYWAAPVYRHAPDPVTGNDDYFADIGIWIVRHVPGLHHYSTPPTWLYDHISLGTGDLSSALQLHWLFAYLFMLNGLFYLIGLWIGGGYKALIPRRQDLSQMFQMIRYYLGLVPAKLLRKPWPHPVITTKYNALQKSAYASMPIVGTLAVLTGWAIHKPQQLGWLQGLFGGYDYARLWHFWLLWVFVAFVIPHVILVIADGWDTFRSMVTGWTSRFSHAESGPTSLPPE